MCEKDADCVQANQDSKCEQNCFLMCKYLEIRISQKCVTHQMAHINWFRNFGKSGDGDRASKKKSSDDDSDDSKVEEKEEEEKPKVARPPRLLLLG